MINWPVEILDNKYKKWYEQIIFKAQARNFPLSRFIFNKRYPTLYTEVHHIIPRSLSGKDTKDNLVRLTSREHFVCHWLLTKMFEGKNRTKMTYALHYLKGNRKDARYSTKITSRVYARIRLEVIENNRILHTGRKASEETRKRISASLKGKMSWNKLFSPEEVLIRKAKRSAETRARLTGKKLSAETIRKISISNKGKIAYNKGIPATPEQRKKISEAQLTRLNAMRDAGLPMPNTGRTNSEETRKKISKALTGKIQTPEWRLKNSLANSGINNHMFGKKHTDNAKKLQSEKAKQRIKKECAYCKKLVDVSNYTRWHGDNCKMKCIIYE